MQPGFVVPTPAPSAVPPEVTPPTLLYTDFQPVLPTSGITPDDMRPVIWREARRRGVDPLLVEAVLQNESSFNPTARSKAGALGLMQLMPDTAKMMGVGDALDPVQNIAGGAAYLAKQLDRFQGNIEMALAAYNAGPEAVEKFGGVPPYPETMEYVRRTLADYRALQGLPPADEPDSPPPATEQDPTGGTPAGSVVGPQN